MITQRLLPLGGIAWLLVAWFVIGLLVSAMTASMTGRRVDVVDRVVNGIVTSGALVVGAALISTVVFVVFRGW